MDVALSLLQCEIVPRIVACACAGAKGGKSAMKKDGRLLLRRDFKEGPPHGMEGAAQDGTNGGME